MTTPEETLIEQTELENKSTLKLYDASRKMIGDRWLVTFIARAEIPVDRLYEHPDAGDLPPAEELRATVGDPLAWEQTRSRRFIDEREKPEIFNSLLADFNRNVRPYLLHRDFPIRYVRRQLAEHRKSDNWYPPE